MMTRVVTRPPPRLFVLRARDEPVAVVFSRGPSEWTHVVHWDLRHDVFTDGAWFRGRIYGSKCDLSPNGRLLLYFCHQGSRGGSSYTDSWTAVSRPPWLHALALWPAGTTYGGGGRFVDDDEIVLRNADARTHPDHPNSRLRVVCGDPELHPSSSSQLGLPGEVSIREGRLFRSRGGSERLLRDFGGQQPDPQPPPPWARRW